MKQLLNSNAHTLSDIAKKSYFYSNSIIVTEEDIDEAWITKLYFEKSLIFTTLENKNIDILEHLEKLGFDITNLGRYDKNSLDRNQMLLWYLLIKYHMKNENFKFLKQVTKKESVVNGPALVGCLCIAAEKEDIPMLEQISKYFGSSWFSQAKYMGHTAYRLLIKHGQDKKADLLKLYLWSHVTNQSKEGIKKRLSEAESFEDFKSLIDENLHWLAQGFSGNFSLLMILVTSNSFSAEKFDYLVKEKKADIDMVNAQQRTFLDVLLQFIFDQQGAERLRTVIQYEESQEVLLKTPYFVPDLSLKIQSAHQSFKTVLME